MTKQEYYNELVSRAIDRRFPAVDQDGECSYRTEDGRGCVVGILIPDNKYLSSFEGMLCNHLSIKNVIDFPDGINLQDLMKIQHSHDSAAEWNKRQLFTTNFIRDINQLDCFSDVIKQGAA